MAALLAWRRAAANRTSTGLLRGRVFQEDFQIGNWSDFDSLELGKPQSD